MRRVSLVLLCTFLMAGVAQSTTVIPPTFESLVSSAETIFVGEVMDVRSDWVSTRQGRAIKTRVTFKVEDVWKGASGTVTQLEFLGGTVGDMTMKVHGMPEFHSGQRGVLFVSPNNRTASPLVGFWHGRLRIEKDLNGIDRVRTHDGRSLSNPAELGNNRPGYMLSMTPMRLSDFASAVRSRVLAGRAR